MKTLNIIGCGRVGKALGKVWTQHGVFRVTRVLNRSLASGQRAVEFLGSGEAVQDYDQLGAADAFMISARDEAIEDCCERLSQAGELRDGAVVFHCSGALSSSRLAPARSRGARVASLHPVKSFADSATAAQTFAGTFCALEGDPPACQLLRDALHRCGAETFDVKPEAKTVYHSATVFVCNYLVALMEIGARCFEKAGVSRPSALDIMHPIVQGTVENVFSLGPAAALTGPIARGEVSVVRDQLDALGDWDEMIQLAYRALGPVTADLAARQGNATAESLAEIRGML